MKQKMAGIKQKLLKRKREFACGKSRNLRFSGRECSIGRKEVLRMIGAVIILIFSGLLTLIIYLYQDHVDHLNHTIKMLRMNKDILGEELDNYKELVTYVEAGKQAMIEMRDYKSKLEEESKTSGNPDIAFKISDVDTALTLMSNRVNDLATSEALALQSIPSYKIQEKANNCLQMKIQSQFITTLPALKQQIANAILTKQNAITLKGIKALDYATNKLIEQSATNAVAQLKVAQEVANTSGIKLETLTTTWNTLIAGARDYKAAEARFEQIRQQEIAAKENLNNQYLSQMTSGEVL